MENKLYISYSWQGLSEQFVEALIVGLGNESVKYRIDKRDLKLKTLNYCFHE